MERTNDPVRGAERYQNRLEEAESGRDYILCDRCGGKIFREDAMFVGDEYYEIDGEIICEDCIDDYLKEHKNTLR